MFFKKGKKLQRKGKKKKDRGVVVSFFTVHKPAKVTFKEKQYILHILKKKVYNLFPRLSRFFLINKVEKSVGLPHPYS